MNPLNFYGLHACDWLYKYLLYDKYYDIVAFCVIYIILITVYSGTWYHMYSWYHRKGHRKFTIYLITVRSTHALQCNFNTIYVLYILSMREKEVLTIPSI